MSVAVAGIELDRRVATTLFGWEVEGAWRPASPDDIVRETASYFQVALRDITGPSRVRRLVHARHVGMYLMRTFTNMSFGEIGTAFGHRDHSTVQNGCSRIDAFLQAEDRDTVRQVADLSERLKRRVPPYSTNWYWTMHVRDAMAKNASRWDTFSAVLEGLVMERVGPGHTWRRVAPSEVCRAALITLERESRG